MNWTIFWGFVLLNAFASNCVAHQTHPKDPNLVFYKLDFWLNAILVTPLTYGGVLVLKWVWNHCMPSIFGLPHLHFQEVLFLDLLTMMIIPFPPQHIEVIEK